MKIGVIGCGAMGEAIVASVLRGGLVSAPEVRIADTRLDRVKELSARYGVQAAVDDAAAARDADYLLLAVKPQDFETAAASMRAGLRPKATVVSIMAGVPLDRVAGALDHPAAVRAMPNTPAQIGQGMTVWAASAAVSEQARADVAQIFECLGRQVYVSEEKYIDMATAVNGSGPGFVFLFVEAFIDAAVNIGLSRELATEMVLQTVAGSARFAQETGEHPAKLRNLVTSPGGTTAEGLRALERRGLRAALSEAVTAAYNKSKALGGS